jgi:hypothetical protein
MKPAVLSDCYFAFFLYDSRQLPWSSRKSKPNLPIRLFPYLPEIQLSTMLYQFSDEFRQGK